MILALDTALETCSAAVLDGERVLAARSEAMARGHQERLAPLVAEVMAEAGVSFEALDRIGVTVGPGSFTGLRVGLAFAKGLGVALDKPVVGVGVLNALAMAGTGVVASVIDARRSQFYVEIFRRGPNEMPDEFFPAAALGYDEVMGRLDDSGDVVGLGPDAIVGPGAEHFAAVFPAAKIVSVGGPDPVHVAMIARQVPKWFGPPRPIYLRAPDAKLPASALPA